MTLTNQYLEQAIERAIDDGNHIQKMIDSDYKTLILAMEQLHRARMAVQDTQREYDENEAGFLFLINFDEAAYPEWSAKEKLATNDAKRKVFKEHLIFWAQTHGPLTDTYTALTNARLDKDDAQLAFDQADKAFGATERSSILQAAELQAIAGAAGRFYS